MRLTWDLNLVEHLPTATESLAWKAVCDSAMARLRGSKRAGSMARLAEEFAGEHRLYSLKGEELRNVDARFPVPPPIQLFLCRFFVALQHVYSLLEMDNLMIGDNVLPGSVPIQGCLVPGVVTGKDEQGSAVQVRGAALILFSSIATMPAQLAGVENITEVVVCFQPNETAVCSFYDPEMDSLVIDIIR